MEKIILRLKFKYCILRDTVKELINFRWKFISIQNQIKNIFKYIIYFLICEYNIDVNKI